MMVLPVVVAIVKVVDGRISKGSSDQACPIVVTAGLGAGFVPGPRSSWSIASDISFLVTVAVDVGM